MFERELQYFIDNQEALVREHAGKFLIIKDDAVKGAFNTALDAYLDAQGRYEDGSYMIQHCEAGPSAYTLTINYSTRSTSTSIS